MVAGCYVCIVHNNPCSSPLQMRNSILIQYVYCMLWGEAKNIQWIPDPATCKYPNKENIQAYYNRTELEVITTTDWKICKWCTTTANKQKLFLYKYVQYSIMCKGKMRETLWLISLNLNKAIIDLPAAGLVVQEHTAAL